MSKLYNYFEKLHKENKIVQAYLIGNTKYDEISNEMQEIINNFFFSDESNTINVDIQVVRSEKGTISKDSIKNIIENVTKTSQFNNKKIYIIDEAELLNDYSYNAILKTLEEPQSNVYAFLITKNMESVKPTISSRCQKIFISNSDNYEIEEDNSIS